MGFAAEYSFGRTTTGHQFARDGIEPIKWIPCVQTPNRISGKVFSRKSPLAAGMPCDSEFKYLAQSQRDIESQLVHNSPHWGQSLF